MNEHMDVTLMIADDESFILRGLKEIVSDSDLPLKLIGTAGNGMDAFALLLSSSLTLRSWISACRAWTDWK